MITPYFGQEFSKNTVDLNYFAFISRVVQNHGGSSHELSAVCLGSCCYVLAQHEYNYDSDTCAEVPRAASLSHFYLISYFIVVNHGH